MGVIYIPYPDIGGANAGADKTDVITPVGMGRDGEV
jgi:hypothetical protein